MIAEVSIRFLAFGKVRGATTVSVCLFTSAPAILEVALQRSRSHPHRFLRHHGSYRSVRGMWENEQEEELFDTLLLVARNVLQFTRLATVMRQYVKLKHSSLDSDQKNLMPQ